MEFGTNGKFKSLKANDLEIGDAGQFQGLPERTKWQKVYDLRLPIALLAIATGICASWFITDFLRSIAQGK